MLKPVEWVGSSKGDLKQFPDTVQDQVGFALYQAQVGRRHRGAKALKGLGASVLEVVARHDGDTLPGGVHGPIQGSRLCSARLPKEGQAGHRYAEAGNGSGSSAG